MPEPVRRHVLTDHALEAIRRRGIALSDVQEVLANPEQCLPVRPGRMVLQRRIALEGQMLLLRVFVDVDRDPAEVVTVYRTGKIAKYWRTET